MNKILASFAIITGTVYSAEQSSTESHIAIQVLDINVIQPVAGYLQDQAATDLNNGVITAVEFIEEKAIPFVKHEAIPFVEKELVEPTLNYVNHQAPKDIEKITKRTEKNVKNETNKAFVKLGLKHKKHKKHKK